MRRQGTSYCCSRKRFATVILSKDAATGERPGVGREQAASESKDPCPLRHCGFGPSLRLLYQNFK
jgi:hypothetical protein